GAQGSTTAPTLFVPTGPPLATGKSKYLGCAYSTAQAPNFGAYWNSTTPENGGKWGSVENTRGTYNWAEADAAYAQAVATGGPFRFHTLIWGTQQPTWLTTSNLTDAEKLAAINTWFQAIATHFQGKRIDFIDVVNEPTHQPPTGTSGADGGGYLNALGGSGTTGWDWVITSFRLARQYFPTAKLMLNEYSVENEPNRAATYITIANLLKDRGLIDAIGIQGHSFSLAPTSSASIRSNMATLAAANLPLYITEFDLDGATDAQQLADYQRIFPLFWENPAVQGITMWGYRPGHWRTAQGAPLVNDDNTERPSLAWLRTYVQSTVLGTKAASAATAGVFLYPNPAAGGRVSLNLPASLSQQAIGVSLLNALGQTVFQQTLAPSTEANRALALPGVARGLYTVRLQTSAGALSQRLTVE
ncbi:MAG: T9SS type A sorting domain-containing protein, partial [Hymenobacter sp.]